MGQLVLVAGIPCFAVAAGELLLVKTGPGASLPGLKTALEGVQGMIALLVAFLLYGRCQRSRAAVDAVLLSGFLLLACNSILVVVDLVVLPGTPPADGVVWGRVLLRFAGSLAIALAAVLPLRVSFDRVRAPITALAGVAVCAAIAMTVAEDHLPEAVRMGGPPSALVVGSHPLVRVALVAQLLLASVAAWGFYRRASRERDVLVSALAVASVVNAASFLAFTGRPSLYTDHVHVGDVLRVLFWLVVLGGAAGEVAAFWRSERDLAVLEERRRVARELHDGLAQELAYIAQQAQLLNDGDAPERALHHVLTSSQRALDESRRAIAVLRGSGRETLEEMVRQAAEDVAARAGSGVTVEVDAGLELDADVRETVVRIVREAVSNAARHGRARAIRVRLGADRVLHIDDDGEGFVVESATAGDRYGILTMRERAAGIDARFALRSAPGVGTSVEVVLP